VLRSDNPEFSDIPVGAEATAYAVLQKKVRPEDLAPPVGTLVSEHALAETFGLDAPPELGATRRGGHLFVLVEDAGSFRSPTHLEVAVPGRRPAETAFVLGKIEGRWRYCGVGRWDGSAWRVPELDFSAWRALGRGRSVSRQLDREWERAAEACVAALGERSGAWVHARGRSCRIESRSARGGLRISGGPAGFKERTVSVLDLGWVLAARAAAESGGSPVDESFVNRLRYLVGTPKGSTRWVDTGWALVLTEPGASVREGEDGEVGPA
jgi:hypothetical protein